MRCWLRWGWPAFSRPRIHQRCRPCSSACHRPITAKEYDAPWCHAVLECKMLQPYAFSQSMFLWSYQGSDFHPWVSSTRFRLSSHRPRQAKPSALVSCEDSASHGEKSRPRNARASRSWKDFMVEGVSLTWDISRCKYQYLTTIPRH